MEEGVEDGGLDDGAEGGAGHDDAGGHGASAFEVVARDGDGGEEDEAHGDSHSDALRKEVLVVATLLSQGKHKGAWQTLKNGEMVR